MKRTRKSANVTTVTLPPQEVIRFKKAVSHYGFEGMSSFFRRAGLVLIQHYEGGDVLLTPLSFEVIDTATTYASKRQQNPR